MPRSGILDLSEGQERCVRAVRKDVKLTAEPLDALDIVVLHVVSLTRVDLGNMLSGDHAGLMRVVKAT